MNWLIHVSFNLALTSRKGEPGFGIHTRTAAHEPDADTVVHLAVPSTPAADSKSSTWSTKVLIQQTIAAGKLQKVTVRRLIGMVESASAIGVDGVLVTCSSIGPAISIAARLFPFPVIRVDDAMAEKAVSQGRRIGVLATLRTTLEPTTALLREKSAAAGTRNADRGIAL